MSINDILADKVCNVKSLILKDFLIQFDFKEISITKEVKNMFINKAETAVNNETEKFDINNLRANRKSDEVLQVIFKPDSLYPNETVIIEFLGKSEDPKEVKTAIFFAFEKENLIMMGNPKKYLRKADEVIAKINEVASKY